jgi:hypothetical protein
MNTSYVVAIPSYQRSDVIIEKTLMTLKKKKVSPNSIYIFVANKTEYKQYIENVPSELYNSIIIGKKGISPQRRFISEYFKPGQYIVSLDDDIEEVYRRKSETTLSVVRNLDSFFKKAYQDLKKHNLYLWGIYPVKNAFFMQNKVTTDLRFIIGLLHGYINRHDQSLYPSPKLKAKDDYDTTLKYYLKDGGVLRYNYISVKTKFYAPGGIGFENRRTQSKLDKDYLVKTYPEYVSAFQRKDGTDEVRLRDAS